MKKLVSILCCICMMSSISCKKKEENRIPREQIQIDGAHDYSLIFKDIIDKEKKEQQRYKKGPFDE
ncbi:MAG: hypothetical protein GYA16_04665 [Spirochaetes bacterium]|nr:hypothetical protein [Spirochaetota bacterium]NMB64145.1 hypothetical protein [Spirochaetota bacterium]